MTGQEREAEAGQSMEGFDQESHSENRRLMEERGTQHPGNLVRLEMGRNQSLHLIQWTGKAARNGDGTASEESRRPAGQRKQ